MQLLQGHESFRLRHALVHAYAAPAAGQYPWNARIVREPMSSGIVDGTNRPLLIFSCMCAVFPT